jgi:hypothetical protein
VLRRLPSEALKQRAKEEVRKNLSISEAAARGIGELWNGGASANVHQQLCQSSPLSSGGSRPASAPPRRLREHEFRGEAELEDSAAESIADSAADSTIDSTVDSTIDSTVEAELAAPVRLTSDGDLSDSESSECSSFDTPYAVAASAAQVASSTQGAAATAAMREAMVCRICERRIARAALKTHSRLCALAEGCNDKLRGNRTVGDRLESLIAAVQHEMEASSGPPQPKSQQGDDAASERSTGSKRSSSIDSLMGDSAMAAELLECITQANECVNKQTICEEYASRDDGPSCRTYILYSKPCWLSFMCCLPCFSLFFSRRSPC